MTGKEKTTGQPQAQDVLKDAQAEDSPKNILSTITPVGLGHFTKRKLKQAGFFSTEVVWPPLRTKRKTSLSEAEKLVEEAKGKSGDEKKSHLSEAGEKFLKGRDNLNAVRMFARARNGGRYQIALGKLNRRELSRWGEDLTESARYNEEHNQSPRPYLDEAGKVYIRAKDYHRAARAFRRSAIDEYKSMNLQGAAESFQSYWPVVRKLKGKAAEDEAGDLNDFAITVREEKRIPSKPFFNIAGELFEKAGDPLNASMSYRESGNSAKEAEQMRLYKKKLK